MATRWTSVLADAGATVADGCVVDFGDPERERRAAIEGAIVTDLAHVAAIGVRGRDHRAFLQGQLTGDLDDLAASSSTLGAWCSPKGRVLALLRLIAFDDGALALLPAAPIESILAKLRMFVLRADVELRDAGDELVRIGLAGDAARNVVANAFDAVPEMPGAVVVRGAQRAIRLPGSRPRWLVVGAEAEVSAVWRAALDVAVPAGARAWDLLDVEAGIPVVGPATADSFVPQMLNLERLGAVSFTKGCYVGQEIIARAQHLGRVKRRMYHARIATAAPPAPGAPVYVSGGLGILAAGTIVLAATHPDGAVRALAVVAEEAAGSGELRLSHLLGPRVALSPIAYPAEPVPA